HVYHGAQRRDRRKHHHGHRGSGPPGAQDLTDTWLAERGEPRRELGIVGGEHALHLLKDALLIHGKRHVSPPPPPAARPSDGTFLTIPCWTIIYLGMTKG